MTIFLLCFTYFISFSIISVTHGQKKLLISFWLADFTLLFLPSLQYKFRHILIPPLSICGIWWRMRWTAFASLSLSISVWRFAFYFSYPNCWKSFLSFCPFLFCFNFLDMWSSSRLLLVGRLFRKISLHCSSPLSSHQTTLTFVGFVFFELLDFVAFFLLFKFGLFFRICPLVIIVTDQ